jgi:hypothetical protein
MKKKSRNARRTVSSEISPADPLIMRGDGAATSGPGVARKVAHLTARGACRPREGGA